MDLVMCTIVLVVFLTGLAYSLLKPKASSVTMKFDKEESSTMNFEENVKSTDEFELGMVLAAWVDAEENPEYYDAQMLDGLEVKVKEVLAYWSNKYDSEIRSYNDIPA
jgi:hypothetical protein